MLARCSAVAAWLDLTAPAEVLDVIDGIARHGGTPLVIARRDPDGQAMVLGVVHLKDVVKEGMSERFTQLRSMGIRTVMITGDNRVTAGAIAAEAGVSKLTVYSHFGDKDTLFTEAAAAYCEQQMPASVFEPAPATPISGRAEIRLVK